ncbi:Hypothetical_protein [Hexamita inflata]|uniref:Hypothetical_protein n=1 Tax=Hexamita inflata TaxID=28002 RepID=A0AA86UYK3_9EUKA|nr:Hypothetical protein HINF_LOCUS40578 [Hexamita inflata]
MVPSCRALVIKLGFFVSARYCKTAVFAQEGVRDFWQECCQHIHGFLVHSAVVTKNEWNHPIIAIRASVFKNRALECVAYICFDSERDIKDIGCVFVLELYIRFLQFVGYWKITMGFVDRAMVTMMVYLGQDTVHHVIMAHCSDFGCI